MTMPANKARRMKCSPGTARKRVEWTEQIFFASNFYMFKLEIHKITLIIPFHFINSAFFRSFSRHAFKVEYKSFSLWIWAGSCELRFSGKTEFHSRADITHHQSFIQRTLSHSISFHEFNLDEGRAIKRLKRRRKWWHKKWATKWGNFFPFCTGIARSLTS